jgi:hypothetical protein
MPSMGGRSTSFRGRVAGAALLWLVGATTVDAAQVPSGAFPTIQAAINAVGITLPQGEVINVAAGSYPGPISVPGGKSFTVAGAGPGLTVISGGSPVLFINGSSSGVRFQGLTLTDGASTGFGGGFLVNASTNVTLANCAVSANRAVIAGGGGAIDAGSVMAIEGCTIQNNLTAAGPGNGGGLFVAGGSRLTMTGSTVSGNSAAFIGGGVFAQGNAVLTFTGVTVSGNTSGTGTAENGAGGGIVLQDASGTIASSTITGNQSKFAAGGIFAISQTFGQPQQTLVVTDSEVGNNTTSKKTPSSFPAIGGGIFVESNVSATIARTRIHDNTGDAGGGVGVFQALMTIDSSFIEDNHAVGPAPSLDSGMGAGLQAEAGPDRNPTILIRDSVIRRNTGAIGAVTVLGAGSLVPVTIQRTLFDQNTATIDAGAMYQLSVALTIEDSQFLRNRALSTSGIGGGGALYLLSTTTAITGTTFADNATGSRGGAILAEGGGSLQVNTSRIYKNSATVNGGGGILISGGPPLSGGLVQNSVIADNVNWQIAEDDCVIGYTGNSVTPRVGFTDFYMSPCKGTATSFNTFNGFFPGNNANAPTFVSFAARPGTGKSVLAWSAARATAINVNPGVSGETAPTGAADVQPACTTTYGLTANNPSRTASATVAVGGGTPAPIAEFFPYDPGFLGGVYVAAGDVTGDGRAEVITGVGAGGGPDVRVFDANALTSGPMTVFFPYDPGFLGGVFVAAGDVTGDGRADIVTGVGVGGGPDVRVFNGAALGAGPLAAFFPYDPGFRGGVFVAAGNVTGSSRADLVTGVGVGGGPDARVFDGGTLSPVPALVLFPFPPAVTSGIRVAAGDINGDGRADIIVGGGPGSGPQVRVLSGANPAVVLADFFAFEGAFTGGLQLGAADVDGDGRADIIVGRGPGGQPEVKVFSGATNAVLADFFAYDPGFLGGVQVAGGHVTGVARAEIITGVGVGGGPHVRVFQLPSCP